MRKILHGIQKFATQQTASKPSPLALAEQPFDSHLLKISRLYLKSRRLFLKGGGQFQAALVSSPRTLSSAILLENRIEYSPIASEMIWSATDPLQRKDASHFLRLRTYTASVFHEQNHRILWGFLPRPEPQSLDRGQGLGRYLNFVESLVITLDMALGDELGEKNASLLYQTGAVYDPGTSIKKLLKTSREYRNYLQISLYATYLCLELYERKTIEKIICQLFPDQRELALRAAHRSMRLDRQFVLKTNPVWQKKHAKQIREKLRSNAPSRRTSEPMTLPRDPQVGYQHYLHAEKVFDHFGI